MNKIAAAVDRNDQPARAQLLWVGIGQGTFPFSSYAATSAAYRATIERLGPRVSEAPVCDILDDAGNVVARVGYNGRIFAVGADGESDYATVLHETGGA